MDTQRAETLFLFFTLLSGALFEVRDSKITFYLAFFLALLS